MKLKCSHFSHCLFRSQALHKVFTKRRLEKDPVPAEELDGVLLVAAWFHRHPEEKERVVSPPQIFQTLCKFSDEPLVRA